MARILLNVEVDSKKAEAGLSALKESLAKIVKELGEVKPNKDLTAQLNALSNAYKAITDSAKKAADADQKASVYAAKLTKAEEDAAKATAQRKKAEEDAAAAVARRASAEARAFDAIEKTREAMNRRADTAAKAEKADGDEEKALWNLEKAFAGLAKKVEDTSDKTFEMDSALKSARKEIEEAWQEVRLFNQTGAEMSGTAGEMAEKYQRLSAEVASLAKEHNAATKEEIEAVKQQDAFIASMERAEREIENTRDKLNGMLIQISNIEKRYPAGTFDQLKRDIISQRDALGDLGPKNEEYIRNAEAAADNTKKLSSELTSLKANTDHVTPAVDTLGSKFGDLVAKYAKFYASSLLVRTPLNLLKKALGEVGDTLVKTEDAVIELNRVLDDPVPTEEAANRLYDLAYQYGSTFENASQIAANFARAGNDWNNSIKATEAALLAMNVAELNATEASDGLLSILAQFDMQASDLVNVVDKLNKTADKNPVSTQKLLTAIQRAGSTAKNANVSFDQTLGLITAISEATNRSGQNIGTAINSLIQYSTKNVDVFSTLSAESAKMVEKFKLGLVSIVDVWNQVAKDIHNDKEARDNILSALGTDGLEELSSTLHDELGDLVSEIDGVYNVANTYRKNYFIALLDNMDRFLNVQEQLTEYQGYSQEENSKYMDTYTAKVNQLNAAWQKLANDEQGILGLKKTLVEIGISLVDFVDVSGGLVNTLGMVGSAAAGAVVFLNAERLATGWATLSTTIRALPALLNGTASAALTTQAAFGWIGIAITALGILGGTIQSVRNHQAQLREETINAAKANEDNARKLSNLYEKYQELDPKSEEYRDIEKEIVDILGDKAEILPKVTGEVDTYREAVEKLTAAQLAQYKMEALAAKEAAREKLVDAFKGIYERTGQGGDNVGDILDYYDKLVQKQNELALSYEKLLAAGDNAGAKKIKDQWLRNGEAIASVKDEVDAYRSAMEAANRTLDSLADTAGHVVGRAGVVPNLEEVRAKAAEAKDAAEDLSESAGEAGESLEELSSDMDGLTDSLEGLYLFTEDTREQAEQLTEDIKDLNSQIDEAQGAIRTLSDAQEEYNTYGSLSIDTLQKFLEMGPEYIALLLDEEGQIRLNEDAADALIAAKQELIDKLIAEQVQEYAVTKLHEYMEQSTSDMGDEAVTAAQKIELAALALAHFEGNEEGAKRAAEDFEEALHRLALHEGVLTAPWEENWVADVKNFRSGLTSLYSMTDTSRSGWSGRETSASSSSSTKDEYLESLKSAVSLRESELTLMEHQGAAQDEQIAKIKEIQEAIAVQADYLRSIGASQEDINKLSSDWWKWQEKINKFAEDNAKAAEKAAEEQKKAAEEAEKAAEAALKAETDRRKQEVADDKARLTLMEKQGASDEERVAMMRQIQAHLHEEAEWLRQIGAKQSEIDALSTEWWDWQEKIAEVYEKTAEAAKKAAEEAEKAETARHRQILSNLKAELTLWQKQGKGVSDQVEEMKRIQSALHDEAEWLRQIGAEQAEIDALSAEWWDWQEKILKLYQETLDAARDLELEGIQKTIDSILREVDIEEEELALAEKRLAVENARRDLTDAIAKARIDYVRSVLSDYITGLSDAKSLEEKQTAVIAAREKLQTAEREARAKAIIDAFNAEKAGKSDLLSLEEKRLAVEKARQALSDAQSERTTRYYNEASGQWEHAADAAAVQSAEDNLKSAVDALNAYVEEAAWNEVAEAVEAGSVTEEDVRAILEKWAKESYGEGSPEFIQKITAAYRKAMGTAANPDSVSGQLSAVDAAVENLNSYLKQEAVKELEAYLAAGNTDAAGMRSILDKWLSLGEGGELYEWRDGLLREVNGAIESGYYDDSQVQSAIERVESAVDSLREYIRKEFISDVSDLVKNGTAEELRDFIDEQRRLYGDTMDLPYGWANDLYNNKSKYEQTEAEWASYSNGSHTPEEIEEVIRRMKDNSLAWWSASEDEKKRLSDLNYALGTMMGWNRKADGAWYYPDGERVYDRGGVLRGTGGIKATGRPEAVLDPELTAKILEPQSEAAFRAFADSMHLLFERGNRIPSGGWTAAGGYSDSHNVSNVINGIPISPAMAETHTIAELCRLLPIAGRA